MLECFSCIFIFSLSCIVSYPDVELEAEPCLAEEFVYGFVIVKGIAVLREELPGIACVFEEHRQLQLALEALWSVYEVDQIQPLVDAAAPEEGSVKRIFVDDD